MWLIFYPLILYFSYQIYINANNAARYYQLAVDRLDLSGQTEMAWKSLLEDLSLSLYQGASEISSEIHQLQQQANDCLQQANIYSLAFLILSIIYLVFCYRGIKSNRESTRRNISFHLLLIAFICLFLGASTPILNLIAFKDLPVLGTVVFKYESKSIFSIISTLWSKDQYFIFILVLIFSFVLPILKLIFAMIFLLAEQLQIKSKMLTVLELVGRWSMTDVFVIAILLAYFTLDVDETSDAWLGHGLYFFASYALLSLFLGMNINKTAKSLN